MTLHSSPALVVGGLLALLAGTERDVLAQCQTTLPQSVITSIQTPELRTAAASFTMDTAMITQNGGLPNMIRLAKAQLDADRAAMSEEQQNQAYLARNGMGSDRRAVDGRTAIQILTESQRLTDASIRIMECFAAAGSGAASGTSVAGSSALEGSRLGGKSTVTDPSEGSVYASASKGLGGSSYGQSPSAAGDVWTMSPAERQVALSGRVGQNAVPQTGAQFKQAMDGLTQALHERAMAKASPEVAAFMAKQDALQAVNDANKAALDAGLARGRQDASANSVKAQVNMVGKVIETWQPPRAYTQAHATNSSLVQDPFATERPGDGVAKAVTSAIGASGLTWDADRKVARAEGTLACDGRLQAGDYPVMSDGNLLDTPARIKLFLAGCGDRSIAIAVLRESGDVEVRK